MTTFFDTIKRELIITAMALVVFLVIFFVFNLPYYAYFLGSGIMLFIMVIYWFIALSEFKKQQRLTSQLKVLEQEVQQLRSKQTQYQNDIESYFLTWVHQIKTPITASKLLLERNEDNVVNRVRQEIIQIDNYTSLALSYLKLMNHETDMSFTKVTVNELVKPLIMKYSIQFIDQHTRIHYDRSDEEVLTDVQWASIMIEQILNNALKYARGKDIWLTFDKGYSGYNGRLNEQSTGIGLFIVKHISNHIHHQVEVDSKLGQGTTFKIYFPKVDKMNEL